MNKNNVLFLQKIGSWSKSNLLGNKIFLQKRILSIMREKLFMPFLLTFVFLCGVNLNAQQIDWSTNYPKLNTGMLTVLSNVDSILVKFSPSISNVSTATITVALPANIDFAVTTNAAIKSAGHDAGVLFSSALTGTATAGTRMCKVTITGGTLAIGKTVSLAFPIKALCGAVSGNNAVINVLQAGSNTTLTNPTQTVTIPTQTPSVRLTCDVPTITYANQTDVHTFSMNMDAINGNATSFKVFLRVDKYSTLSNFKVNGATTAATITKAKATSAPTTDTIYTITFTAANLLNSKLDTTAQTLSFDASSARCNAHSIITSTQYPSASACNTVTGTTLTMSFNGITGLPSIGLVSGSAKYLASDKTTVLTTAQLPKDLASVSYITMSFKNTGTADAWDLSASLGFPSAYYGYLDETNIQYQIDGGAVKTVSFGMITGGIKLTASYVKAAYLNKYYRVVLALPEALPIGSTITFWVPCYTGNINDYGTSNVYIATGTRSSFGYSASIASNNLCTDNALTCAVSSSSSDPNIRQLPSLATVKPNQTYTNQLLVTTGSAFSNVATTYSEAQFFVEIPSWLSLSGTTLANSFYLANASGGTAYTSIAGVIDYGVTNGVHKYSVSYNGNFSNSTAYLTLKYKTGSCLSAANASGQIHYWINWQLGQLDATHPALEKISQVYQDVIFQCADDGIVLNDFSLVRATRGLTDADNNSVPDATGGIAASSVVRNDIYLTDAVDSGYIRWNATVSGTTSDKYKYLYFPVTLTGLTLSNITPSASGTMSINGGADVAVQYTKVTNSTFYVFYDASAANLKGGDVIEVHLPFKATTTRETMDNLSTGCFVSNTVISTPLDTAANVNKHGACKMGTPITLCTTNISFASLTSPTFLDNNIVSSIGSSYCLTYSSTPLITPYFPYEIRRVWYPERLEWDFPDGYLLESSLKLVYSGLDATLNAAAANNTKYLTPTVTVGSNITTYAFNVASLFDLNYVGNNALTSGEWQLPDDKFQINTYVSVKATRRAPLGQKTWNTRLIWKNLITGAETTKTSTITYTYKGLSTSLSLSSTSLPAYSQTMNIPVVTIGNPSSQSFNNVWLYVAGNVKNVSLSAVGSDTPALASGEGFENRWVKVSNLLAASSTLQYQLNFTYGGNNNCSKLDTITVYTVSGFDISTWTVPTTSALDLTDIDHIGANKQAVITIGKANITGSLSVSNPDLSYNQEYTLAAKISSKSSEGSLKNPKMTITIPAGQSYTNNSAVIEYPIGTKVAVPASVNDTLLALNSNLSVDRTFIFDLRKALGSTDSILMPGYLANNVTDQQQEAVFTANYTPLCDTKLTGMNFKGVLNGSTACGNVATNNGSVVYGQKMNPASTGSYTFSVSPSVTSANQAFNEYRTTDELQIKITKITRLNDTISSTDYVQVEMPSCINITGSATYSGGVTGSATVNSNTVADSTRTIKLTLPVSALNSMSVKNTAFILKMPVQYIPNGQKWVSSPVDSIEARMITVSTFGVCTNKETTCGTGYLPIALVAAGEAPYKGCLNMPTTMKITSKDFKGAWYLEKAATTLLGSDSTYAYTPTVQTPTIKYLYVSAVFGGINYGIVPVELGMNTLVTANFTVPSPICLASAALFSDSSTVGSALAAASNTTSWNWYADGSSIAFSTVQNPSYTFTTAGTHTIKLKLQSVDGCVDSISKSVKVNPLTTTWVGTNSSNWNTAANWSDGIPNSCTDTVFISAGTYMPDISGLTTNVVCKNIVFKPATSIFGLEKLTYNRAFVKADLKRNKWYMLASPLKEMCSGDYYFSGAPVTYMRLFGTSTASSGTFSSTYYVSGDWTKTFASLTEKLSPGKGFAFKIDTTEWHYPTGKISSSTDKTITFPRTNSDKSLMTAMIPYSAFSGKLLTALASNVTRDTVKAYRFAMEDVSNQLNDITIHLDSGLNLVANPLMSYLDFIKVQNHNSSLISSFVKFWDDKTSTFGTITTAGITSGAAVEGLSTDIPPMKSFIVNANHAGNLVLSLSDFEYYTGSVLLKAGSVNQNSLYLEVDSAAKKSSTAVLLNTTSSNNLDETDAPKLFSGLNEIPEVYTVSDNKSLDINQFGTLPYTVPVGIKAASKGTVDLKFIGAESFDNINVSLINAATGETQDLKSNANYSFNYDGTNSEGTLYVEFKDATVTTETQSGNSVDNIKVLVQTGNKLHVVSSSDNQIKEISVFDAIGRQLLRQSVKGSIVDISLPQGESICLVRVQSDNGTKFVKVLLK